MYVKLLSRIEPGRFSVRLPNLLLWLLDYTYYVESRIGKWFDKTYLVCRCLVSSTLRRQSWQTIAHASLATQSANLVRDCPVGATFGAKIWTWTTNSEWKTFESLDFAVEFQLVFRYETVVFRRYVLSLLLVGLLRKFEAYLLYLTLIWGKFPRCYLFHLYVSRFSRAN